MRNKSPNNVYTSLRVLKRRMQRVQQKNIVADTVDDIAANAGDLRYGRGELSIEQTVSYTPYANPLGFSTTITWGTHTITSQYEVAAFPVFIPTFMDCNYLSILCRNTSIERSWCSALYVQDTQGQQDNENVLRRVMYTTAETFTAAGATPNTMRQVLTSGAELTSGVYWLVIQNAHASNSFNLGAYTPAEAAVAAMNWAQTKTLTDYLYNDAYETLDFTAATWTKVGRIFAAHLHGYVFGSGSYF
jgi:hypothetical protein